MNFKSIVWCIFVYPATVKTAKWTCTMILRQFQFSQTIAQTNKTWLDKMHLVYYHLEMTKAGSDIDMRTFYKLFAIQPPNFYQNV